MSISIEGIRKVDKNVSISVIMLTYNRENLLSNMIECILNQTYRDFEFIIIDNGSTDTSGDVAAQYAKVDKRIQVKHIEKSSIGKGRNAGLSLAQGKYVAFVDDDDTCDERYLETLYELVSENDADIAICGTDSKSYDVCMQLNAKEALIHLLDRKYYNVGFPTKLIKRELFTDCLFDEESRFDDIYLMPKIIGKAKKIVYHGLPYYIVNRHESNNSAWTTQHNLLTRETLEEYLSVYRKRTEWLIACFPEETSTWQYYEWSFMISMVQKINTRNITDCEDICEMMRKELSENKSVFLESSKIQDFEIKWMEEFV